MNLMEESFQNKEQQKKKKTTTIILICMALIFIAIIAIMIYISNLKNSVLKIYLDGKQTSKLENLLIIDDDTIYVKIKEIAPFFKDRTILPLRNWASRFFRRMSFSFRTITKYQTNLKSDIKDYLNKFYFFNTEYY